MLGVIAGLTAGLAMAAVAGARRTATALPRLSTETNSAHAVVFPSQVGVYAADWGPLEAKPYITGLARWNLVFGTFEAGSNLGFGAADDGAEVGLLFPPSDDEWLGAVDRPIVVEGRMFHPAAADEVVVDEHAGLAVGDTFTFTPFGPDQIDLEGAPPDGPELSLRVVGVIRFTSQFLFQDDGFILPSPGMLERYGDRMAPAENAHVRLGNPATDVARLQRDANDLLAPGTPILDFGAAARRVETTVAFEETALLVLAGLVTLAGVVFVGQALGRSVAVLDDSREALRALGFTRADLTAAAVLPHVVVAAVGGVVAMVLAVALSPRFPIGFAGRVDPDRAIHADWIVLGPGVVLTAALLVGGSTALGWAGGRRRPSTRERLGPARSLQALRRALPPPLAIGVSAAFDPGRGPTRVPARPALVGAIAAVLGLAAVFTVDRGLTDARTHPERVGVTWQALVVPGFSQVGEDGIDDGFVQRVLAEPGVDEASEIARAVVDVDDVGVQTFAIDQVSGGIGLVALSGRPPRGDGEAAIGPVTAARLEVGLGDTVEIGPNRVPVRIVGEALFPSGPHAGFTEGVWISPATFATAVGSFDEEEGIERWVAVGFTAETDAEEAIGRLGEALAGDVVSVDPAEIPPELANLTTVAALPVVLGVFLALLAVSTLAHGLVTTVRRRRHHFGVLRALGFTRPMTRAVVASHSTAVGVAGLALGIPLGLTLGRLGWAWVAEEVPLQYVSPVAASIVVILVPAALATANIVGTAPAWWASRLRPAEVLRSE